MLTILQWTHPNLLQKDKQKKKKRAEATGYLIGNKMADKITVMSKIFSKQLQMGMIKKYLKNDTYLENKGRKSLMIED